MRVYVVYDPMLGWDSVIAVYDASKVTLEELQTKYNDDAWSECVIDERGLRTEVTPD